MSPFAFHVEARDPTTRARTGLFTTPHGPVPTPVFMPVGTYGSIRGLQPREIREAGTSILLANAFHLLQRPGPDVVRELGGLHGFMGWDGPILTDSGGYQIFSLRHLATIDDDGATVRSTIDGTPVRLTPESVIALERDLGADVIMAFDHCPADPEDRAEVEGATARTAAWLARCVTAWREGGGEASGQALFGIVQGGAFADLRASSVEALLSHDLPGHAIGGVSLGERPDAKWLAVETAAPLLPEEKPRYLMGVGLPLDLIDAVAGGIDMFDCVTPTRHGRNHQAFTSTGRLNLRRQEYRRDERPLDAACDCATCTNHSRGYLRHLAKSGEMLAAILLTVHNLRYFHRLMEEIRAAVPEGALPALRERIVAASRESASRPGD